MHMIILCVKKIILFSEPKENQLKVLSVDQALLKTGSNPVFFFTHFSDLCPSSMWTAQILLKSCVLRKSFWHTAPPKLAF